MSNINWISDTLQFLRTRDGRNRIKLHAGFIDVRIHRRDGTIMHLDYHDCRQFLRALFSHLIEPHLNDLDEISDRDTYITIRNLLSAQVARIWQSDPHVRSQVACKSLASFGGSR